MFEPIEKKSLSQAVFEQLRTRIVSGAFSPGEPLPGERRLADILGVNRGAVREALKRLEQARLVSIQHGGSTTVLNYLKTAGMDLLAQLVLKPDGGLDLDAVRSLMELRSAIGPDIARRCATRWTDDLHTRLTTTAQAMQNAHLKELQALNMTLWGLIVSGADNVAYQLAFNSISHAWGNINDAMRPIMRAEISDVASHLALAEAIGARDPARAEAIARDLVTRSEHNVRGAIDTLQSKDTPQLALWSDS